MRTAHKAAPAANDNKPVRTAGMPAQYKLEAGGLLRLPEVLQFVPVGRSTWLAMVRAGRAPKPIRLSARCTAWHAAAIAAFIANPGNAEWRP